MGLSCSHTDPYDVEKTPWSCDVLTPEPAADRDLKVCSSGYDENCQSTGCCSAPGMHCYEKNSMWATCKPSCTPGIDANDLANFRTPWSCTVLTSPVEFMQPRSSS